VEIAMQRLARTLLVLVASALPAAAYAADDRDWLITGQTAPRSPDLLSRNLTPPPLDLATTQTEPGQWLSLPSAPQQIPQAELDLESRGAVAGADACAGPEGEECYPTLGEVDAEALIEDPGLRD
jgi:hypothetical protein